MFKMCKNSWIILVPFLGCFATANYPPSEEILPPILKDHELGHIVSIKTENRKYDFQRCTIELPEQMGIENELEFSPKRSPELPENIERSYMSSPTSECYLNIRDVDYKHAGKWIMRSYVQRQEPDRNFATNHTVIQEFTIRFVVQVDGMPKREMSIKEGNNLFLRLKDPLPDMISCSVRSPDGKEHMLWQKNPNTEKSEDENKDSDVKVQYWSTSPKEGHCGMKMIEVKNNTAAGEWHLEAVDKNQIFHKATIKVYVEGSEKDSKVDFLYPQNLTLGQIQTVDLAPKGAVWCRATPAKGGKDENCRMSFDPVKKSDAKKWKVTWVTQGSAEVHNGEVEIIVREFHQVDTTIEKVNVGDKTNYNLLCRIKSKGIQHCVFERPDGKIINLEPGVGTGRYSYYGEGFYKNDFEEKINECGLSIENSQEEDNGVWKCSMNDANEKENQAADVAYLRVGINNEDQQIPHSPNQNKEAMISGNLTMACWIRASLDYCLFRHPNGTTLGPEEENSYSYDFDLRTGRCGLHFNNVTSEEAGEWNCLMGISGGNEIVTKHVVNIHEDAMVSHGKPAIENKFAIISCSAIDNVALSYCKFMRPDGKEMRSGEIDDKRYEFTGELSNGVCNLTISEVSKLDHGTWRCSARLLDNYREISAEHRLFVPLTTLSQSQTPIILIVISSLALILIGVSALLYKYKKRESSISLSKRYSRNTLPKPDDPIPFYLEADSPTQAGKV